LKLQLAWQMAAQEHHRTLEGERPFLIGRLPKCDLFLDDPSVSPEHALMTLEGFVFHLRNVSHSDPIVLANGTRLKNGQKVSLKEGDTFQLGQINLRVLRIEIPFHQLKVKCSGCERLVAASLTDCLWCGTSLAAGSTAVVVQEEE
jgi:predicted component of type VI protein secretion system